MNKKNNKKTDVSWIKPSEPSFLKKFKNDVGYKEGPTVDTKRAVMPTLDDDDSGSDREDELPQVVVLKKGDLSADEVKKMKGVKDGKEEKDDEAPADGKILFKKPAKRSSSDKFQGITASSSKKKKSVELSKKEEEEDDDDDDEDDDDDDDDEEKKEVKKEEKKDEKKDEKKKDEKKEEKKEEKSGKKDEKKEEKSGKKVKNRSLLSFGDDEEED